MQSTGILDDVGAGILALDGSANAKVMLYLLAVSGTSAVFSAGPGMAMALPVAGGGLAYALLFVV